MKRYILTIALALCLSINLSAQFSNQYSSDGFFSSNYSEYREGEGSFGTMPLLPGHNTLKDYDADPAPVGSGLLLLAGLGLGYASLRKLKNEN